MVNIYCSLASISYDFPRSRYEPIQVVDIGQSQCSESFIAPLIYARTWRSKILCPLADYSWFREIMKITRFLSRGRGRHIAEIIRCDKTTYTWFSLQGSTMRGDWLRFMKCQLTIVSLRVGRTQSVSIEMLGHNVKATAEPLYAARKRNWWIVQKDARDSLDWS